VNPKVPVDLETICFKAMEKDPDRRYQTAGAMADDLRRYGNRFAISARRAGPVERLRKWVRRHPGLAAGVGVALVAIVLAGFFAVQSWRDRQERIAARASAQRRLLQEKMQQVQDHVLNGNFPAAEDAIHVAEELGVPQEWAQWRRGQILFHRGELEKAIRLLELAIGQMPENAAANWLLGAAYLDSWNWQRFFDTCRHCDSLTSSTAEELLYKSLCDSFSSPDEGLNTLDGAMARQPSLIAHLVRAQIRASKAMQTNDAALARTAMDDVTAAKIILRGKVLALVESVHVHHVAAILYGEDSPEGGLALQVARADAAALAKFPDVPLAVERRGDFLEYDEQEEEAFTMYEQAMQQKEVGHLIAKNYAFLLYERGEAKKAVKVIEDHFPEGFMRDIARCWFVAELPDGPRRVREICDQMPEEPAEFRMAWRCVFRCYLGKKEEVPDLLRGFRLDPDRIPARQALGFGLLLNFLKEPGTEAEKKILQGVGQSRSGRTFWHFEIGLVRLGEGDRASALRHFKASVEAHDPYTRNYKVSRAFLKRMEKDRTWPPWIPVEK
jgi:tetratricopeptide (TPR) repeat protein